jgi:CubicO group peptidase (beta-lactamase class C family)
MSETLDAMLEGWPVERVAAAVIGPDGVRWEAGDRNWTTRIASISKVIVGYAGLVATEEGTISLDESAGRPGATFRHLLSHAAGYDFDSPRMAGDVGTRRVYSNVGIEVFAAHLAEAADMTADEYIHAAVLEPLAMAASFLDGSPAHGIHSSVEDLGRFAAELLRPSLISPATHAALTSVQFPGLGGVLPGFGRFEDNAWGVGAEIKADKQPHWAGSLTSPATFGHFGGSGTFLWVDPTIDLACVVLTDREFGPWAVEVWPTFSDEVVRRFAAPPPGH